MTTEQRKKLIWLAQQIRANKVHLGPPFGPISSLYAEILEELTTTKKFDNDAAIQVAEEAFRAGFKAGWEAAKAERIYPIEREEQEAWDYFEPAEDIKELVG